MGLTVTDSSVLIAVLDNADACHEAAVHALGVALSTGDVLIPAVAFAEALVAPYRQGNEVGRAVELQLAAVGAVLPISAAIASAAARLRANRQVKLPDALIIASGTESDASEIVTFDERWKNVDPRVRVIRQSG